MTEPKLRLNWHSNAPWTSVGYGVQTRIFAKRIKALGYPTSITAFYGLQGAPIVYDNMQIYPVGRHPYGQDVIGASAVFDHANAIISHMDIWVQSAKQIPPGVNWYPWYPIDCEPMPKIVYEVAKTCTKGIVFSKFGKAQAEAFGLDVYYVPCGVETDVFKPGDMTASRSRLGWPQDKFIVGMVAANKGNPPRKVFFEQIMAFKALHTAHPDTMLYLHTDDGTHAGSGDYTVDLVKYCQVLGLQVGYMGNEPVKPEIDVLFCDQYTNLIGLPDFYLVNVYNALDVLTLVSLGEGFGIPLIEAQACFPSETQVEARGIVRGMVKNHTGEMIRIHTQRGTIDATPNHPFWTNRGWVQAKDLDSALLLWYNGNYEEKHERIHKGRIGDIVSSLPNDVVSRSGGSDGEEILFDSVANSSDGSKEINGLLQNNPSRQFVPSSIGLYSRVDRRGGDDLDTKDESRQDKTLHSNSELIDSDDGLARERNFRAVGFHGAQESSSNDSLYVSHRGIGSPSALQGVGALLGSEEESNAIDDRVLRVEAETIEQRPVYESPDRNCINDTGGQYEPILKVERYQVKDLPVYNFTTKSSTYLANGYLVHNCGCPVITGEWTSMGELCFSGWKIPKDEADLFWNTFFESFQWRVKVEAVVKRMEAAYTMKGNQEYRNRARVGALAYDADRIVERYWKPVLADMEAHLIPELAAVA